MIQKAAFLEDKEMLQPQQRNRKERSNAKRIDIVRDAGPGKMLWVIDKFLKQEVQERSGQAPECTAVV